MLQGILGSLRPAVVAMIASAGICHSHHRLLGQAAAPVSLPGHQLEPGGDLRDLHGTPPEI